MLLSHSEEMHDSQKLSTGHIIMMPFNSSLCNFITMWNCYEKALGVAALAAKGYLNDLVKMWELAIRSWVSWEFGDILFQMTQVQNHLAEMLQSFHRELLALLQQKVGLHPGYPRAVLEKHQAEQRSKGNALDRSEEQLEKLLKKSQVH